MAGENTAYVIIGDVHGMLSELKRLWSQVAPQPSDKVIFLGDLIDKGPDSNGVVSFVREKSKTHDVIVVEGNHESSYLRKYPKANPHDITPENIEFLEDHMVPHYQFMSGGKKFSCVHGGFYPAFTSDYKLKLLDNDKVKAFFVLYRKNARELIRIKNEIAALKDELRRLNTSAQTYEEKQRRKAIQPEIKELEVKRDALNTTHKEHKELAGKLERFYMTRFVDSDGHTIPTDPETLEPTKPGQFWADVYQGEHGTAFYGHSPYKDVQNHPHAYGLDTGAVYKGKLSAAVVRAGEVSFSSVQAEKEFAKGHF